jgi:hypothetical protein
MIASTALHGGKAPVSKPPFTISSIAILIFTPLIIMLRAY